MRDAPAADPCRAPRIPATIPIRLVVEYEGVRFEAEASTVDLSVQGVRVRTSLALLPGGKVGVIPREDYRHAIPARVVWTQRAGTDQWSLAGLEFLETVPT